MAREFSPLENSIFGIIPHVDAGKTTTTERVSLTTLVRFTKNRWNHEGASQMDRMEQETWYHHHIRRCNSSMERHRVNIIIDTPGHVTSLSVLNVYSAFWTVAKSFLTPQSGVGTSKLKQFGVKQPNTEFSYLKRRTKNGTKTRRAAVSGRRS